MTDLLKLSANKKALHERKPASEEEILKFEDRYNVKLPRAVRNFYLQTNGFEPRSDLMSYWPLSEIAPVSEKLPQHYHSPDYRGIEVALSNSAEYFAFADWSIWCHVYAFKLTQDRNQPAPVVWIDNGQTWHLISESFESFLNSYLSDFHDGLTPPGFYKRN